MSKPYFLIDFENVQPKALDRLRPGAARIKVFLGQHQTRLMLELVQALQPFGADAQYIAITGSGPDAVDFHIAFYIGRLAAAEPGAAFNIISKDRGFDPLVRHLNALGIRCQRLAEIPVAEDAPPLASPAVPKATKTAKAVKKAVAKKSPAKKVTVTVLPGPNGPAPKAASTRSRVAEVVACLKKASKPSTLPALRASIASWVKPAPDARTIDAIVHSLRSTGTITVTGNKVAYALD